MTEEKFIHTNLKNELTHDFLVEILKHYHYEQKDMEMLKEVAGELRECLAGEEGFYCMTRRQCEQILNLCKGTISVENVPGSGCRFTVVL